MRVEAEGVIGRKGIGLHVVEYAIGGLSREEVALRLAALEVAVTKLQQAMPKPPAPKP